MRPATSPESAADPIARAVANRAGAVLDPHDRATLEHAARGGLADAIARAHAEPSPRSGRSFGPRWPSV